MLAPPYGGARKKESQRAPSNKEENIYNPPPIPDHPTPKDMEMKNKFW